MKKYEMIKQENGMYRIKALRDFGDVRKGELGGLVEKESNLSHIGNAWIYGNAWVYGNAKVYDDAGVYGEAMVYDNAEIYGNAKVYGCSEVYEKATISDNAKIYGRAMVYGDSIVYEDAKVYGNARVLGEAEVRGSVEVNKGKTIGKVSSAYDKIIFIQCSNRIITIYKANGVQYCNIGCQSGMTLEQLEQRIIDDGGMKPHRQQYLDLMEQIKL